MTASTSPRLIVEGLVLPEPRELHQNSLWLALRTDRGVLIRCCVARSFGCTGWLMPGCLVRLTGTPREKVWADGGHVTLSCHENVEIILPVSP